MRSRPAAAFFLMCFCRKWQQCPQIAFLMQPGASSFLLQGSAPVSACPSSGAGTGSWTGLLRPPCECRRPGASATQFFSYRSGGWQSGVQVGQGWFPGKAWRQLPSLFVLAWPFACACGEVSGISFASRKDTSPVGLGTHPMTSFNLNHPLKGSVSKCSHVGC